MNFILSQARKDPSFRSFLISKLAKESVPEEEGKKPSSGKGRLSGKFLQFMKEMGDKPFTNPDTGNKVKLKSLKGPKGKKLVKSEFEKWLKEQEKKEKSKSKSPRKEDSSSSSSNKEEEEAPKEKKEEEKEPSPKFLSPEEREKWTNEVIEPTRQKWSKEQIDAVMTYTSDEYVEINGDLRSGNFESSSFKKTIQEMDSLFASPQGKLPTSAKSIRGVSKNHALVKLLRSGQLTPGCTFEDKGYQSTTMKSGVEDTFGDFKLHIEVPKGTEAIYLGDPPKNGYSEISSEYELLLNRGTKLEVVSFDADSRSINVRVVSKK